MKLSSQIIEYKYKKIKAYKGIKACCSCGEEFMLDTVDKTLFDKPLNCFKCFMMESARNIIK